MNQTEIIKKVLNLYKTNARSYQIDKYLASFQLSENEENHIKDEAKKQYKSYVIATIKKRNKLTFWISLFVFLFCIFLFFFYLPKQNIVDSVNLYAIIGTLFICLSAYNIYIFRDLKNEDFGDNPKPDFDFNSYFSFFGLLSIIPGIILVFVIKWQIEDGAEKTLFETKILAKGVITSGTYYESISIRRRRPDEAEVTVKFKTKENKIIRRTIEIPTYEFERHYKGEQINLIYSSENPRNIKLLTNNNAIKEVFKTEERDILVDDLMRFLDLNQEELNSRLNSISYGWEYDKSKKTWINKLRSNMLTQTDEGILFVPKNESIFLFDNLIRKYKFIPISEGENIPTTFENEAYTIDRLYYNTNGNGFTSYYFRKKQPKNIE